MKKKFIPYVAVWAILLALFHVVVFVTPNEIAGMSKFGGGFWIGYGFTLAAFFSQLFCAWIALKPSNNRKIFYNLPLILISFTVLILTMLAATVFMAVPQIPAWIAAIVCSVLTAFGAIAVIKAKAAAETVSAIDEKVKAQTSFIKELTARASVLMTSAQTPELKVETKKVYEAIRYSDPMSNVSLAGIEAKIAAEFAEFEQYVAKNASSSAHASADRLLTLLNQRAAFCKMGKQ